MAGDWIPWDIGLESKPETLWIADRLGIGNHETAGRLMVLWSWANQNTVDGDARGVTFGSLDRIAGVTGMAQAMSECKPDRWLELIDGGVRFPHFDTHNSNGAKKRLLTARRMSLLRAKRHTCDAHGVTKRAPTEEKRREESVKTHGAFQANGWIGRHVEPAELEDRDHLLALFGEFVTAGILVAADRLDFVATVVCCRRRSKTNPVGMLRSKLAAFDLHRKRISGKDEDLAAAMLRAWDEERRP